MELAHAKVSAPFVDLKSTYIMPDTVLLCPISGSLSALRTVRGSQTKAESAFLNFKGQPALFIIVGLVAASGVNRAG